MVNNLHKKKIQNRYVRKGRNRIAIYLVHCKSFDCTVGYMMHQVISEFINLFVEKHFHLNNVNFSHNLSKAAQLSWLKRLSSKQEMVSSKLVVAFVLAAEYQMAAKYKATVSFELTISCLLDRRFNQLSCSALL